MAILTGTYATQTLTAAGVLADAETVIIGSKTYTFEDTLTNVDGNVHVGADAEGSLANLYAAINLSNDGESSVGAGTDYAAAMTKHPEARASAKTATTLVATALSPGTVGNLINTTETGTNISWGAATMAGATGTSSLEEIETYLDVVLHTSPFGVNSGIYSLLKALSDEIEATTHSAA